jgi:hypothetical protein
MSTIDPTDPPNTPATAKPQQKAQQTPSTEDQLRLARALGKRPGEPRADGGGRPLSPDQLMRELRRRSQQRQEGAAMADAERAAEAAQADDPDRALDREHAKHDYEDDKEGRSGQSDERRADAEQDIKAGNLKMEQVREQQRVAEEGRAQSGLLHSFRQASHQEVEKKASPSDRKADDDDDSTDSDGGPVGSADAILARLASPAEEAAPPAPTEMTQRSQATFADLVRDVAERILVGESGPAGQEEVRITLRDELLSGSEVRISEHEGAVHLTFVAESKDAEQFLGGRREEISSALSERLNREVHIEVVDREAAREQQRESNEGRSRNRRTVQDERES